MKSPLLERQHHRFTRITPRPLGKDKDILPVVFHLPSRTLKCLHGLTPIHTVDKDRPTQAHEPAQERDTGETLLRGDGAVLGEDPADEEDVQFGLVVADDDHRSLAGQVLLAVDDDEADAGGVAHDEVKGTGGGPLGESVLADEAEGYGGEDAVGGADEEGGVGGEDAGDEAEEGQRRDEERQDEEGHGEEEVGEDGEEGVVDD